jgi:hypothetical protein
VGEIEEGKERGDESQGDRATRYHGGCIDEETIFQEHLQIALFPLALEIRRVFDEDLPGLEPEYAIRDRQVVWIRA